MSGRVVNGRVRWDWWDRLRYEWMLDGFDLCLFAGLAVILVAVIAGSVVAYRRDAAYWRACEDAGGHSVGTGHYTTRTDPGYVVGGGPNGGGVFIPGDSHTSEDQTCSVVVPEP